MFLLYEIYIHVQFTLRIKNPLYISGKMFLFTQEADGGERESSTVAFYGSKLPFSLALSTHTHIKRYTYTKYICTIQLYTHILCEYVHIFKCTYVQYSYTVYTHILCTYIQMCYSIRTSIYGSELRFFLTPSYSPFYLQIYCIQYVHCTLYSTQC